MPYHLKNYIRLKYNQISFAVDDTFISYDYKSPSQVIVMKMALGAVHVKFVFFISFYQQFTHQTINSYEYNDINRELKNIYTEMHTTTKSPNQVKTRRLSLFPIINHMMVYLYLFISYHVFGLFILATRNLTIDPANSDCAHSMGLCMRQPMSVLEQCMKYVARTEQIKMMDKFNLYYSLLMDINAYRN